MRKHRNQLLGLALVLAIGLALMTVGCGTADEGAIKTYTDSDYGFSFDYPSDWKLVSSTSEGVTAGAEPAATVTVGDPEGAVADGTGVDLMMVRVYELNAVIDESLLPQAQAELENLIAGMQAQDPSMVIEQPLTLTELNGLAGYQIAYTFDWDADTPVRTTSYFLFDGAIEYQLVVQSAEASWAADQDVFATFFSSFRSSGSAE